MFHRRGSRPGPYLVWRIRLLGLAMVLALLGMGTGLDWIVNVAIGVAVVGLLLRFLGGPGDPDGAGEGEGRDSRGGPGEEEEPPGPPNPR